MTESTMCILRQLADNQRQPFMLDAKGISPGELAAACREVLDALSEIPRLQKLAYLGDHHFPDLTYKARLEELVPRLRQLEQAIRDHRAQKADDRCIEDDDRLYAALGDGIPCDRRVGDKAAMLANCARFIERRCEGGHWPSYAELEAEVVRLRQRALNTIPGRHLLMGEAARRHYDACGLCGGGQLCDVGIALLQPAVRGKKTT